jgi:glycosyltransferase involved in cell wall biosynthesis
MGKELEGINFKGTYFINYALYDESRPRPHAAWFTHIEPKTEKKFWEVAHKVDLAICQNHTIAKMMPCPSEVIYPGTDQKKEIIFGVAGRTYPSGRKGENKIKDLDAKVIALGDGWPCEKFGDFDKAEEFYRTIDYLIITSEIEGGPVPLTDAIGAGVPVIAPRGVGNCDEFPCIRYGDLKETVKQLTTPPTWKEWRKKHQQLLSTLEKSTFAER